MEHFVAGTRVLALCEYVKFLGFDADQLLQVVGIETVISGNPDEAVPAATYYDLFQEAARVTGMTDFGLRWGRSTDFRTLGPVGTYMRNCASIREAAQDVSSFVTARNWGVSSRVVSMGSRSRCEFHVGPRGRFPASQFIESLVMTVIPIASAMVGGNWRPSEVWFVHQPLSTQEIYRDALGCPVRFGMLNNAVVAETPDFDREQARADGRIKTLVGNLLRESELRAELNYVTSCKSHLRRLLQTQQITINHLGARLGVNPAVLQDRLQGVGLSFRTLVTQVRLEIAVEELNNGGITPGSIVRLGFARANEMNRFLKRHAADIAELIHQRAVG